MKFARPTRNQLVVSILLVVLLTMTVYIYWPGINCCFILDDAINLHYLEFITRNPSWHKLYLFVMDGIASELGRPVSLITFAAQHYSWPNNPEHFKYVNLVIHLLNGILIFVLGRQLFSKGRMSSEKQNYLALIIAAIWLLHPIQVSTVLYVIQRMAQLSCLFTLISLICYIKGRFLYTANRKTSGALLMTVAYGFFGIIAILSKENAILLPLFVLSIEYTFLRQLERDKMWKIWAWVFAYIPLILLSGYLISSIDNFMADYANRNLSMSDRLLSEARILIDYIGKIFIIQPNGYGIYNDDYLPSKGLFNPISTPLAVLTVLALLISAYVIRNKQKYNFIVFGILWFFAAHLLESSFIPLELYFEHRNYLAILGPIVILVFTVSHLINYCKKLKLVGYTLITVSVLWMLVTTLVSRNEIQLWSKPLQQALIWAKEKPRSKRAQIMSIPVYAMYGRNKEANDAVKTVIKHNPDDAAVYLTIFQLRCFDIKLDFPDQINIYQRLETANASNAAISTLGQMLLVREQGKCAGISNAELKKLLDSVLVNKKFQHFFADVHFLYARYYILLKDADTALKHLRLSSQHSERIMTLMYEIQTLSYLKKYDDALEVVSQARKIMGKKLKDKLIYTKIVNTWEKKLRDIVKTRKH